MSAARSLVAALLLVPAMPAAACDLDGIVGHVRYSPLEAMRGYGQSTADENATRGDASGQSSVDQRDAGQRETDNVDQGRVGSEYTPSDARR